MDWEAIKTTVIAFFTTGAGAGLIAVIITAIKDYAKSKLTAKATKLNDLDKDEIAGKVLEAIKGKISIDMTDELNKATRNLINEFKGSLNDVNINETEVKNLLLATANVIAQFKTVQGTTALDELNKALATISPAETTPLSTDEVIYEVKEEETKKSKKVSY